MKLPKVLAIGIFTVSLATSPAQTAPITAHGAPLDSSPQVAVQQHVGLKPLAAQSTAQATGTLNIRSKPNTASKVLGVIPKGAIVTLTGGANNGWYPITYNGINGWASGKYLKSTEDCGCNPAEFYAYPTTSLNVREQPSCTAKKIATISKGTRVFVQDAKDGWHQIQLPSGKIGWASGRYLVGTQITTMPDKPCKTA